MRARSIPAWAMIAVALLAPARAPGEAGGPATGAYLMSFHACDPVATTCTDPANHRVYLAESDDGLAWTVLPGWEPFAGSVPDVVRRGETLYLFTPGRVARYHMDSGTWDASMPITVNDAESPGGFVDPSAIVDAEGRIVLFYLQGIVGQDPARCAQGETTCTKRFRSATEVEGSDGTSFTADTGDRATMQISSTQVASDPDVFAHPDGFVLYVSGPNASSITALRSRTLQGTYQAINTLPSNGRLSDTGGIPSGYYDEDTAMYWTFAHTLVQGRNVIRRAVHPGLAAQIVETDWTTVVTGDAVGLSATANVESPGFAINESGLPDTTRPEAELDGLPLYRKARTARLEWSGTDDDPEGVLSYEVRKREAAFTQSRYGDWSTIIRETTDDTVRAPVRAGTTVCFGVRATDEAGNVSPWTPKECTIVPVNDRSLRATGLWEQGTADGAYLGTYTKTRAQGAVLTLPNAKGRRFALIVTRCDGCGAVEVFLDDDELGRVSLEAAETRRKRVIEVARFEKVHSGALKIVVVTSGEKVQIEGVAVGLI